MNTANGYAIYIYATITKSNYNHSIDTTNID